MIIFYWEYFNIPTELIEPFAFFESPTLAGGEEEDATELCNTNTNKPHSQTHKPAKKEPSPPNRQHGGIEVRTLFFLSFPTPPRRNESSGTKTAAAGNEFLH